MDTLLLFRDTTCSNVVVLGETVPTKVIKVVDSCQSCANGTPTNCNDLGIAISVCVALVTVALITKCAILSWKKASISSVAIERKAKELKDRDESFRKQKSDLINKLLDFLKEKTSEKNEKNGQQANGKSLLMSSEDIYSLLRSNASKSNEEELRQRYIELCVKVLQKLKSSDGQSDDDGGGETYGSPGKTEGKPSPASSGQPAVSPPPTPKSVGGTNPGEQILDNVNDDNSNKEPESKKPSDIYIDVLCFLIAHVEKGTPDEKDLDALRESCGLPPKTDE